MSAGRGGRARPRRAARLAAASVTLLMLGLLAMATAGRAPASAQPAATTAQASTAATTSSAYHATKTIERVNLIDGKDVVVDRRTVSLSVSNTANLIDRQAINVSWTGAHPTGGIFANPNQGDVAQFQEYPMVLLECHGNPSSSAPLDQQITPEDCWTATPSERIFGPVGQEGAWPAWRLDRYATAVGQRDLQVNVPHTPPKKCSNPFNGVPAYWLPYASATGTNYPIGPAGCQAAGLIPNEMSLAGGLGELPSNETFAATHPGGRGSATFGSATFDVWTNELNTDLGCSQRVPCALVAVPIMGISCDPAAQGMPPADRPSPADEPAAAKLCEETGAWPPGTPNNQPQANSSDTTVTGELWWAASNWRNRFVVPLSFATPASACSSVGTGNRVVQIYGSELMEQAAPQWQPHFCLNSQSNQRFTLGYTATSDQLAEGQLASGSVEAAMESFPSQAAYTQPVVHAPVAATGFAISFLIDDPQGNPVTTLRLDARLLAKLLTESYPGLNVVQTGTGQNGDDGDPEIQHSCLPPQGGTCPNPMDITVDPEFRALNSGLNFGFSGAGNTVAASVLLALSSNSDATWALTSYINADPAARAWLNGTPDPWGMTVNSVYRGIKLPVNNFPLNSTYYPASWLAGAGPDAPCYASNPTPVLNLLAEPQSDMTLLTQDLALALQQSQIVCAGNPQIPVTLHLAPAGQEQVGHRFMIGITTLGDARRSGLNTASLLTYTAPGTPSKFTSSNTKQCKTAGAQDCMTFAAPTNASLSSAVSLLTADPAHGDWNFPYSLYQQDSTQVQNAYPGTTLVYADIPTRGVPKADAADYAAFLRFAATSGQVPGTELPDGYLPMTAANHLGAEAAYTACAAAAVAAQKGTIPDLSHPCPPGSPSPSPSHSPSPSPSPSRSPSPSPSHPGSGTHKKTPPSTGPLGNSRPAANVGLTPGQSFGLDAYVLLAVAGVAVLGALASVVAVRLTRPRGQRFRLAAGGAVAAAVTAGLTRLRGKKWG
jgi:hypothetical protein